MGEKMKIRVFKLNWIEQRKLEFDGASCTMERKKKEVALIRPSVVDSGYMDTPDRDYMFDNLSIGIEGLSIVVAQSVDSRG